MASTAVPFALLVAGVNTLAAALGAWRWARGQVPDAWFWRLVRAGQASAVLFALVAGALAVAGRSPSQGLFWLYVVLPLVVAFVAEQLRAASAQSELDARGFANAQAVGELPEGEQRDVVVAILRREMVVMAVSCGVVVFLVLRAASTV